MMEDIEPKVQYIIGPNGFLINVPIPQFSGHFTNNIQFLNMHLILLLKHIYQILLKTILISEI